MTGQGKSAKNADINNEQKQVTKDQKKISHSSGFLPHQSYAPGESSGTSWQVL